MRDRGASLLETAIIIPILFMFVFGLVEFGRYITLTSEVTNASREAARYAVTTGAGTGLEPRYADCDGMRNAAKEFGVTSGITDGQIVLVYDEGPSTSIFLACSGSSVDSGSIQTGDRIVVTITVPFEPIAPLVETFFGPTDITVTTTRSINKG